MQDDPRWIRAKFASTAKDGTPIKRGDNILWYPRTRTALAGAAAAQAWRDFEAARADEAFYNGGS